MKTEAAELLELEEPIIKAQNLAYAILCFASSDPMRGECGSALATLAETLVDEIGLIKERWKELLEEQKSERGTS